MTWFRVLRARLFALGHKTQLEMEMEEELRFHLEMRAQENVRRGMPPAEAAIAASRQFGNIYVIKDAWRDVVGAGIIEALGQDLRFAWRTLLKDRAFAIIAVLALALGIGANTALFTVVSNVLLQPLPFPAPEKLISILVQEDGISTRLIPFSFPDFREVRTEQRWFSELGAYHAMTFVVAGGDGGAIHAPGARITPEIIRLLGVAPALGRGFLDSEDEPGSRSILISHELWQERFHGRLTVLGESLQIDGYEHKIIGVMPPGFEFPVVNERSQVWTTFARDREPLLSGQDIFAEHRDAHYVQVLGRLAPGVSRETATTGLNEIAARLAAQYPETNRHLDSCALTPWLSRITGKVRPALLLLIGAAACVLCVACANVANLLLARASTRQKEIAVRTALGAGRGRLLRQLLAESLLLSALGGCLGLVLALLGTHYIVALLPPDFPRSANITPDFQMLAFTALISVVTSCVFGFAPAWHAAQCELARVLNDCSRGPGGTPRGRRARNALVIAELVLAFILLAGAWTLIRGFFDLQNAPLGFDPRNLVTTQVSAPYNGENAPAKTASFYREVLQRLQKAAGIQSAAAVYPLPFTNTSFVDFEIEGKKVSKSDLPRARAYVITAGYLETMEIPLKTGRQFDERDQRDAPPTVIINETLARNAFPNENALGKRIRPGLSDGAGMPPEREIVGIVGNIKNDQLAGAPLAAVYLPHPQCSSGEMTIVVRSGADDEAIDVTMKDIVRRLDPAVPVDPSVRMEHYLAASVAQVRLSSILMTIFALTAVVLTGVGVYGVMAYSVAQRRHEIGIRLALGAQKLAVFRLILGEGLRLLGWSLLAGAMCAAILIRVLQSTTPVAAGTEFVTIGSVAVVIFVVALIACWWPAQRAATVDPLMALGQRPNGPFFGPAQISVACFGRLALSRIINSK